MPADRPPPPALAAYPYVVPLTTRWMDNDAYGHINNVAYYSFFDTAANHYLIERGGLDPATAPVIGLVVASSCHYHAPLAYPATLRIGVRLDHLGRRAATYGLAVFAASAGSAAAHGQLTHVFVDRATRRPVELPATLRAALEALSAGSSTPDRR